MEAPVCLKERNWITEDYVDDAVLVLVQVHFWT